MYQLKPEDLERGYVGVFLSWEDLLYEAGKRTIINMYTSITGGRGHHDQKIGLHHMNIHLYFVL
jgi:hypothetical protein